MENSSIILGVCNGISSGATLLVDGAVIASVNEERFTRVKNDGAFPKHSIEYCLSYASLKPKDIDFVVCGAWGGIDENFLAQCINESIEAVLRDRSAQKVLYDRNRLAVERDHSFKSSLLKNLQSFGFSSVKIEFYDHHLSHAYTAFYPSPFEEALVLTMDGRGDFKSATVSKASRSKGMSLLDSVSMYNSLGYFYAFITRFLGFTPMKHEGKITGLAAFGNEKKCIGVLRKIIDYSGDNIIGYVGKNFLPYLNASIPSIEKELSHFKPQDIAAGAQLLLEDIAVKYLKKFLKLTRLRNVCLAGGVFANVKLNQKILELRGVDNIYVFPEMSDGGNAFGGALIKLYQSGGKFNYPLQHVYLGPEFSDSLIEAEIKRCRNDKVKVVKLEGYSIRRVAQNISNGAIVGFFQGRMEYGPRALGARSILARATGRDITKILNTRLHRTEFMPFAPVTLEEYAKEYYTGWEKTHISSRFMTVCYKCTGRAIRETPAIAHVDGTARPQIINQKNNPLYYKLLHEYNRLTGIPTLINTSFNNHEEPIVCSPEDALKSLLIDNVDYVVMGNFVVSKQS